MLKKTIPFLFIGLLLMFFIWRWLSSFTPEIQKIKKDLAADLSLQGITLKQGKDGQIIRELTAKRANYSEEKKEIFLDEPGIVYYVGQDRKKLNIFAPQGKVNQQKDEAELWPQVTAFYEDISLRANRARYKGKLKKIFLDGPVEARKGFDASQGGNASTSLSNHSMVLKAKNAVIDLETETIEAVGGVNAILGTGEQR
jgi:LPS export ABC transporter protein LptC